MFANFVMLSEGPQKLAARTISSTKFKDLLCNNLSLLSIPLLKSINPSGLSSSMLSNEHQFK